MYHTTRKEAEQQNQIESEREEVKMYDRWMLPLLRLASTHYYHYDYLLLFSAAAPTPPLL